MWTRRVMVHVILLPSTINLAILGRSGTDFIESLHVEINNGDTKVASHDWENRPMFQKQVKKTNLSFSTKRK